MKSDSEYRTISTLPKIGRPKKFTSVEELEERIQGYFDSCFVPRTKRIRVLAAEKTEDEPRRYEYVDAPVLNNEGQPVYDMIRPLTVTGLAVALDTSRDVLLDYENKPENAEYSNTIKKAKQMIQTFVEERLFAPNQVAGAIFALKNNHGWVDRTETDVTSKGNAISSLAVSEKAADILKLDNDAPPALTDGTEPEHDQQG